MPLYEYRCGACGHRFERIQKFSDAPVQECPACGASPVEKLMSSPAIQFKGSGWYITDYAKSGANKSSADTSKDAKGAAEGTGKTAGADASSPSSSSAAPKADGGAKPAPKGDAK